MRNRNFIWIIIVLVLLQTFLIVLLNISYYVRAVFPIFTIEGTPLANLIISSFLTITSISMIYVLFSTVKRDMQLLRQDIYMENLKESLNNLRAQRHDFINHLQTVYGMLQIRMPDAALDYISTVCNDVRQPSRIIEMNQPVLAALIQTKAAVAEAQGINFQYEIQSDLKGLLLPQMDITSIFGNLLDNAIEATADVPHGEKRIWVRLFKADDCHCFEVGNTGPVLPLELQQKIFERGFTTKNVDQENHGQGLYIVRQAVTKNNGRIEVRSSDQGTVFTVKFPILALEFAEPAGI